MIFSSKNRILLEKTTTSNNSTNNMNSSLEESTENGSMPSPQTQPPPPAPPLHMLCSSVNANFSFEPSIQNSNPKPAFKLSNRLSAANQQKQEKIARVLDSKHQSQMSYFIRNNSHQSHQSHVNYGYSNSSESQECFASAYQVYKAPKHPADMQQKGPSHLIRESSQLLPHSIEKQMAKNLQNLKFTSNLASSSTVTSSSINENASTNQGTCSGPTIPIQSTCLNNLNSNQQLRDEDAWLPILNIVQEQVGQTFSPLSR
jgi:hypothetical protein